MKYFRLWVGYDKFLRIDENDAVKALAAQMTGGVAILGSGSVNGNNITLLEPDYHRAMGWNEGYELTPEDWKYINRDCGDYNGYVGKLKEAIKFCFENKKSIENLPAENVLKLASGNKTYEVSKLTEGLVNKLKI